MPESVMPLIAVGVVAVLFILLVSLLSNNDSLNSIKSKTVGDGQHGTARWATAQEIRKSYASVPFDAPSWRTGKNLPEVQGLILGSVQRGKQLDALVDRDDVHCLMIGASGVGKTAFFLYPNLEFACASGMSYLALDTKGDLARNYGTIAKKYYGYHRWADRRQRTAYRLSEHRRKRYSGLVSARHSSNGFQFFPDNGNYFCEKTVELYNKISIQFNKTNLPNRPIKISLILFGVVREFERQELRSVEATEELNLISDEVAINTLDFTLDSMDDIDFIFQEKQPVYAYNGKTKIGTFYIDDSTRVSKNVYNVSCIDALGVLDEDPFSAAIYTNANAKTVLEDILSGHFVLELADDLTSEKLTGYIPDCTRREALQQV